LYNKKALGQAGWGPCAVRAVVGTGWPWWLSNPRLRWGQGPEQPCSQGKPQCGAASI